MFESFDTFEDVLNFADIVVEVVAVVFVVVVVVEVVAAVFVVVVVVATAVVALPDCFRNLLDGTLVEDRRCPELLIFGSVETARR